MFNKVEIIGFGASVFFMALALYLVQANSILFGNVQTAQVIETEPTGLVIVDSSDNSDAGLAAALVEASDTTGKINRMVIDDVKLGTGDGVKEGDVAVVHYVGTLQDGTEFDNSRKRGQPFEFKVGAGMVIEGWDKGVVGMQPGGQRVLVIPPEMGYGDAGIGPIPGGATLVFSIELVEIK